MQQQQRQMDAGLPNKPAVLNSNLSLFDPLRTQQVSERLAVRHTSNVLTHVIQTLNASQLHQTAHLGWLPPGEAQHSHSVGSSAAQAEKAQAECRQVLRSVHVAASSAAGGMQDTQCIGWSRAARRASAALRCHRHLRHRHYRITADARRC